MKLKIKKEEIQSTLQSIQGIELTDTDAIANLFMAIKDILFDSIDIALDTVYKYCPDIQKDKERIEDTAIDEEVIIAFVEVARRLFPFGALKPLLRGMTGLKNSQT